MASKSDKSKENETLRHRILVKIKKEYPELLYEAKTPKELREAVANYYTIKNQKDANHTANSAYVMSIAIVILSLLTAYLTYHTIVIQQSQLSLQSPILVASSYSCVTSPSIINGLNGNKTYLSSIKFTNDGSSTGRVTMYLSGKNLHMTFFDQNSTAQYAYVPYLYYSVFTFNITPYNNDKNFSYSIKANTSSGCFIINCNYSNSNMTKFVQNQLSC